ncbi:hypothetical protein [Mycolicibacterium palauense]|uniref:hypothetical protein n=1 Tax=Mycolicibacterium palauense TaxID=2034511 RepID=UPI000BFEE94B|nr:hypothetical protein [Mycolicibacterium palauense]
MNDVHTEPGRVRGGRMQIPRSRGAASGILLILLGAWGALIGFVGPYFDFGLAGDAAWTWTAQRFVLQVLPGVVVLLGGVLLVRTANRAAALLGGWAAIAAGGWFVIGPVLSPLIGLGDVATTGAAGSSGAHSAAVVLASFGGLGAVIVLIAALGVGRLSVRSVRDVDYAQRRARSAAEEDTPDGGEADGGEAAADRRAESGAGAGSGAQADSDAGLGSGSDARSEVGADAARPSEEQKGDGPGDDEPGDDESGRGHGWQRLFGRRHREPVSH